MAVQVSCPHLATCTSRICDEARERLGVHGGEFDLSSIWFFFPQVSQALCLPLSALTEERGKCEINTVAKGMVRTTPLLSRIRWQTYRGRHLASGPHRRASAHASWKTANRLGPVARSRDRTKSKAASPNCCLAGPQGSPARTRTARNEEDPASRQNTRCPTGVVVPAAAEPHRREGKALTARLLVTASSHPAKPGIDDT